jgi:hypothetical protein
MDVPLADYYRASICQMENLYDNVSYFVFSDDIDWAKLFFTIDKSFTYVDFNDGTRSHEDFHLMSNCKHNIIANSSFSWWAAWLNKNTQKTVIAPKTWFLGKSKDYSDIIPVSWIAI